MSDLNLLNTLTAGWEGYPVILAVLFASLVGSTHCLAMCGPVSILLKKSRGNIHLYNLGRLITYLFLGFIAGSFGELFLKNNFGTVSLISTILLSAVIIYLGVNLILNRKTGIHVPFIYSFFFSGSLGWLNKINRYARSLIIGIINGFIPCGWLYVFLLASITMKSGYKAAFIMFFFWLGTVPSLTLLSYFSNRAFKLLPQNLGRIAGALLILAGLFNLTVNFIPGDESKHHHDHKILVNQKYSEVD